MKKVDLGGAMAVAEAAIRLVSGVKSIVSPSPVENTAMKELAQRCVVAEAKVRSLEIELEHAKRQADDAQSNGRMFNWESKTLWIVVWTMLGARKEKLADYVMEKWPDLVLERSGTPAENKMREAALAIVNGALSGPSYESPDREKVPGIGTSNYLQTSVMVEIVKLRGAK